MSWDKTVINRARVLRMKGKTYSEINSKMKISVSKTTFNYWFRDLLLSDKYRKKVERLSRKAIIKAQKVNKKRL
jgi:hypothetical protein